MLIGRKARRIWETTGDADQDANWFRARLYTTLFYNNIVDAVIDNDPQKTLAILKAFQFSKSPRNRYLIINGFEAAVAIDFLNKEVIEQLLTKPGEYDFSIEPVEDWPGVKMPQKLRYSRDGKELIYVGVMEPKERDAVKAQLTRDEHKAALDRLYDLSRLEPYEESII